MLAVCCDAYQHSVMGNGTVQSPIASYNLKMNVPHQHVANTESKGKCFHKNLKRLKMCREHFSTCLYFHSVV